MPLGQVATAALREAVVQVLWDAPLYQGIFNVKIERAPTRVRFRFLTFWPCFARVEVFRMVHGELDLDMEPENLVRTEYELFGSPRDSHSLLVTELSQEARYWYRISVPRKTPDFPDAKGFVRSRGEFFTPRRNSTVTIDRLHIYDDSDTSGDGELEFSLGLYNASDPRQILMEPRFTPETGLSSGDDFLRPFGPGSQTLERAPDFIGVYVFGVDDDSTFWGAPWYGLGIVGTRPPPTFPDAATTSSRAYADVTSARHVFATGGKMGRQEGRFDFDSAQGRLRYSVHGRFVTEVFDTLADRSTPPWKKIVMTRMALDGGGKFAGLVDLPDGAFGLALLPEGRLALGRTDEPGRWQEVDGPAFATVDVRATSRGGLVLFGIDTEGGGHLAHLREPRRDQPAWQSLGRNVTWPPAFLDRDDGDLHLVFRDGRHRPWHVVLPPAEARAGEPGRLDREPGGRPVLGRDQEGHAVLAMSWAAGGLLLVTIERDGNPIAREVVEGPFDEVLAIAETELEGVVLVASDRDGGLHARRLADRDRPFEPIGTLEDLLEGLDRLGGAPASPAVAA